MRVLAIEDLTRGFLNNETRWIEVTIEEIESFSMDQLAIENVIKNNWRVSIDSLKIVFQKREKHKYECNQACYSTEDPNNILSSQKYLSTQKISSI